MFARQMGANNDYINQEQIIPINIRMMKQIKVSPCEKKAMLNKTNITYLNVIGRKQNCFQQLNKGIITINDDTECINLVINLISEFDQNLFNKINQDCPKLYYYNFILRARVYKREIIFDIQTIQQVNQSAMIIYQMIKILTWARLHEGQKQQTQSRIENEEDQQILIEVSNLNEDILTYLGQNSRQGKTLNEIIEYFRILNNIEPQDIKKSIAFLLKDGKIENQFDVFSLVIHR
ncbi:unnamed protein product (macronuclear) [Paramecium tetraurelia]|uniref:Replication protein A C-terminal domain-containing protein n=1 Tax=Paramecium tetraurelia TaxID=5888 RepID=A0CXW9_PARTE|nr:uncharacterized protein GSPATT00011268001 [Paramecium tetraurelia]CAK75636.1 unnamed protein product [Paramecium tetraurelia]|eukprot:XP_001443033.1 hypothetical protein (macronuclear) [Paramecium tetraurelia strain d4-2]